MDTPRAAVGWVESLTKQPPPSPDASLCTYLRDGRVLCMLANALSETNEVRVRPRDRFRTYHALESVSLFLRWARDRALIDDNAMFTSAQLIDEQDEVAVLACLQALETKFKPISNRTLPNKHGEVSKHESSVKTTRTSTSTITTTTSTSTSTASVVPTAIDPVMATLPTASKTTCTTSPPQVTKANLVPPTPSSPSPPSPPPPSSSPHVKRSPLPLRTASSAKPSSQQTPKVVMKTPTTTITPPSASSPGTPSSTKAPSVAKAKSKLTSFLAIPNAPATVLKAPQPPTNRHVTPNDTLSQGVSLADSLTEKVEATTSPKSRLNPTSPVTSAPGLATTTTQQPSAVASQSPSKLGPSALQKKGHFASAYLAAIESSSTLSPPPPPPPPTPPKLATGARLDTSPTKSIETSRSHIPISDSVADPPTLSPPLSSSPTWLAYEPLATTTSAISPPLSSMPVVVTIPTLESGGGGFAFAFAADTKSVVMLVHNQLMWPHMALESVNNVRINNGRMSLTEWQLAFQALTPPFECHFRPRPILNIVSRIG